ncbi:MAG: glycine cleavage system protein GcvH [Bacteroidota bacterium]|jgi:glycine cleavage system H protein
MNYPSDLLYTKDHEWVRISGEIATVGITEFAAGELGDIVYVEVETLGEQLEVHDIFGTVEAVKTVSDLFMPISGEVIEVNTGLNDTPEVVNSDPYGDGWMIKVHLAEGASRDHLMNHEDYKKLIGS